MKRFAALSLILFPLAFAACKGTPAKEQNPLYGVTFRNIAEVSGFENVQDMGGGIASHNPNTDNSLAIHICRDGEYLICILEECFYDESNDVRYKILDTMHVGPVTEQQWLMYANCQLNGETDNNIVALATVTDEETYNDYFENVTQAWRINPAEECFEPIKDVKGIRCYNEASGV